jgi:hypothetical protein
MSGSRYKALGSFASCICPSLPPYFRKSGDRDNTKDGDFLDIPHSL